MKTDEDYLGLGGLQREGSEDYSRISMKASMCMNRWTGGPHRGVSKGANFLDYLVNMWIQLSIACNDFGECEPHNLHQSFEVGKGAMFLMIYVKLTKHKRNERTNVSIDFDNDQMLKKKHLSCQRAPIWRRGRQRGSRSP